VSPTSRNRPTTRAGREQAAREAAARRLEREQREVNVRASTAPETLAPYEMAATPPAWEPVSPIGGAGQPAPEEPAPAEPVVELIGRELSSETLEHGWKAASKIGHTLVRRMDGPFEVDTLEGTVVCADGWLAIDAAGNPYPIAASVFGKSYVVVRDVQPPDGAGELGFRVRRRPL
jgi:hypothetical protein